MMAETNVPPAAVVELGDNHTVTLPDAIARMFKPADRFLVTMQGDTVLLKRISPVNVLDRVEAVQDDEAPPTLDEINAIVHAVRQQYQHGQQDEDRR